MVIIRLSDLKRGNSEKVVKITGEGNIRKRLLDMGLITGSIVEMQRVAPLGDPVEIKVKGYNLSIRKAEAVTILVEVDE